jgi:hypothetical protein
MNQRKNFSFESNAGLGNQLMVLYHIYNTFPEAEDLFFPSMDSCRHYFNCEKFRSAEYFNKNRDKFQRIDWDEVKDAGNILRFTDLQLTPEHQAKIDLMVESLGNGDLVAVHMRHGDYDHWNDGKFYFSTQRYLDEAEKAIANWGLKDPVVVVFSNERKDGVKFSWDITGGEAVHDLFFMSHFNYFIRTFSTFSGVASRLSQNRGLFKDEVVILN